MKSRRRNIAHVDPCARLQRVRAELLLVVSGAGSFERRSCMSHARPAERAPRGEAEPSSVRLRHKGLIGEAAFKPPIVAADRLSAARRQPDISPIK
jgi:hypothetical protein